MVTPLNSFITASQVCEEDQNSHHPTNNNNNQPSVFDPKLDDREDCEESKGSDFFKKNESET